LDWAAVPYLTAVSIANLSRHFFFAITIVSAAVLRWPGAWVGGRLGIVAHHALGWFTAAIGSGIAILILNFAEGSDNFLNYLGGGSDYAVLGGLLFATMVEVAIGSFEHLRPY
jgi:hypothetical protein